MKKYDSVIKEIQVIKVNTLFISDLNLPCQLTTTYLLSVRYVLALLILEVCNLLHFL